MRNFKDFTRAIAGIATALNGINTVVDDIPVPTPSSGGVDYSETEQDTGIKWLDGKTIYCKTLSGTTDNDSLTEVTHGISNFGTLIQMYGVIEGNTNSYALPGNLVDMSVTSTQLSLYTTINTYYNRPYHFTLLYTKSE